MFIKQGPVSKRPITANYGMKFYSTIVFTFLQINFKMILCLDLRVKAQQYFHLQL